MLRKLFKSIIVLSFIVSTSLHSNGQGVYLTHGIDGGVLLPATGQGFDQAPFIGYVPRLVLKEIGMNSSIGLNSYINVGMFDQKVNFPGFFEISTSTTFVSVPLVFQYDIGAGATKYAEKGIGFFAGAGIDYSTYISNATTKTVGIVQEQNLSSTTSETSVMGTGGIRFGRSFGISLRGSYLLGFDGNNYATIGAVINLASSGGGSFKAARGGRSRVGNYPRSRQRTGRAATWSQRLFPINKPSIQRDRPTPFHRTYYK